MSHDVARVSQGVARGGTAIQNPDALRERGGGHAPIHRRVRARRRREAFGTTGLGSARLDLKPAFAEALATSRSLISVDAVQQVRRGFVVVSLSYPFSPARYDLVTNPSSAWMLRRALPETCNFEWVLAGHTSRESS